MKKPNQVRRESTAAARQSQLKVPTQPAPESSAHQDSDQALSWNREQAARRGIHWPIDPDIPGVCCGQWSDGALLDFVGVAIYDAEASILEHCPRELLQVMKLARMVVHRVRVRGMRKPDEESAPELWWLALPGLQSAMCATDVNLLCDLTMSLYPMRHRLIGEVLPHLTLDRAVALADALVIAETNDIRNGCETDKHGAGDSTPVQECAALLRERWLLLQTHDVGGASGDLPESLKAWAKGGAR